MENDNFYISLVKNEDNEDALKVLIDRHSGIYVSQVNKVMCSTMHSGLKQDVLEDKDLNIYKWAKDYDPKKNVKFSTFVGNKATWKCKSLLNNPRTKRMSSIENYTNIDFIVSEPSFFEEIDLHEKQSCIEGVLAECEDQRAPVIFDLRYNKGEKNKTMPWKEVAKYVDLSYQGCIDIHNKLIKEIQKKYEQRTNYR